MKNSKKFSTVEDKVIIGCRPTKRHRRFYDRGDEERNDYFVAPKKLSKTMLRRAKQRGVTLPLLELYQIFTPQEARDNEDALKREQAMEARKVLREHKERVLASLWSLVGVLLVNLRKEHKNECVY